MTNKIQYYEKNNIEDILKKLSDDYFEILRLSTDQKKTIFSEIAQGIISQKTELQNLIVKEIKLTKIDAQKEVERAYKTFLLAEENVDYPLKRKFTRNSKIIVEKRVARGPILAITPFSSPLSSPAHKIALGLISGTSILFKPSSFAYHTGDAFFRIINKATDGKYVYLLPKTGKKELENIISDNRIGIISFTGGYDTGVKIIKAGGVKKYHMELAGGNSPVIFTPDFNNYSDQLIEKLVNGIIAKNGQRCVSIKHIFLPISQKTFFDSIQKEMFRIKNEINKDYQKSNETVLGALISTKNAKNTEEKINEIVSKYKKLITSVIPIERRENFLFPTLYSMQNINKDIIVDMLNYELTGPVVFNYFYKDINEYKEIISALQNDYIRSGLQLSFYTKNPDSIEQLSQKILWGGIIINDIPTLRDEFMSFGGFGKAGLGKEGFFETLNAYTDPKVIVYPD